MARDRVRRPSGPIGNMLHRSQSRPIVADGMGFVRVGSPRELGHYRAHCHQYHCDYCYPHRRLFNPNVRPLWHRPPNRESNR